MHYFSIHARIYTKMPASQYLTLRLNAFKNISAATELSQVVEQMKCGPGKIMHRCHTPISEDITPLGRTPSFVHTHDLTG
jgi:hypothetical protein